MRTSISVYYHSMNTSVHIHEYIAHVTLNRRIGKRTLLNGWALAAMLDMYIYLDIVVPHLVYVLVRQAALSALNGTNNGQ